MRGRPERIGLLALALLGCGGGPAAGPPPRAVEPDPVAPIRAEMRAALAGVTEPVVEQVHGPFLLAVRTDAATAARIDTFCRTLLPDLSRWLPWPDEPVRVYVFDTKEAMHPVLGRLLGADAPPEPHMGRYDDPRRTVTCSMQWGLGWLGDLCMRAMLAADWRDRPKPNRWFHPAVQSLLYNCFRTPDGAFHGLNVASYYRPQAQRLLETGKAVPLAKFLRDEWDPKALEEDQERVQGRELLAWLLAQGKFEAFYRRFRDDVATDPSGIAALEAVCGKPLEALAADQERWLLAADGEIGDSAMGKPFPVLGVLLARVPAAIGGARVFAVCPAGPAARTDLLAGDLILTLDGEPVDDAAALLAALQAGAFGRTARLGILHEDAERVVDVLLDRHVDG